MNLKPISVIFLFTIDFSVSIKLNSSVKRNKKALHKNILTLTFASEIPHVKPRNVKVIHSVKLAP